VSEKPGLSGAAFFDLYTDLREESGKMLPTFPAKGMFNVRTFADAVRRRHIAGRRQREQLAARKRPVLALDSRLPGARKRELFYRPFAHAKPKLQIFALRHFYTRLQLCSKMCSMQRACVRT
jgi:hypothetical protein